MQDMHTVCVGYVVVRFQLHRILTFPETARSEATSRRSEQGPTRLHILWLRPTMSLNEILTSISNELGLDTAKVADPGREYWPPVLGYL